jgi:hypothetical protein
MPTDQPHRILPADHPLSGVFAVGPRSPASMRRAAAEVVGFSIGQRVRSKGKTGTVLTINPADREVGLTFSSPTYAQSVDAWFCPSELTPKDLEATHTPRTRHSVAVPA